jgi:hypothetical protein
VLSSAAGLMKNPGQAERGSGVGLKMFGFIAESMFTFIPESPFELIPEQRSESSRNRVHLPPDSPYSQVKVGMLPRDTGRLTGSNVRNHRQHTATR